MNRKINTIIEKWIIQIFFCLNLFFILFFRLSMSNLYEWLIGSIGAYIVYENSTLITISTLLVGMYLTIFIFLLTINNRSIVLILDEANIRKMIGSFTVGLVSSCVYIVASIFFPALYSWNRSITYTVASSLISVWVSASIRSIYIIYLIFRNDLEDIIKKKQDEISVEKRYEALLHNFLNNYENEVKAKEAQETSDIIKRKT